MIPYGYDRRYRDWHHHDQRAGSLYLIEKSDPIDVLSLADAKAHLRVDHTDEDDLIEALIAATVARVDGRDGVLGRALIDQTWDLKIERFPSSRIIRLPLPPLIEVESVKYIDTNGDEQTFSSGSYHVSGVGRVNGGFVTLRLAASWPKLASQWPEPVTVRFRAGYLDIANSPPTNDVPVPIVQAIKLIIGHQYENRGSVIIGQTAVEVPQSAEWLLAPFRVYD